MTCGEVVLLHVPSYDNATAGGPFNSLKLYIVSLGFNCDGKVLCLPPVTLTVL